MINMFKKKIKSWHKKVKRKYKNLDLKTKIFIYFVIGITVLSFANYLRAGEIEVIGSHSVYENNRLATFIISVTEEGKDKDVVRNSIDNSSKDIKESLVEFGISEENIKTVSNYIFEKTQNQDVRFQTSNEKVWEGGVSIEVRLNDINKAKQLSNTLIEIPELQVYGPSYTVDMESINESEILAQAVKNAKKKAREIAASQGKIVGRIISIEELSASNTGVYGEVLGLGGGSPESQEYMPGTSKITKSVKVRFVIR